MVDTRIRRFEMILTDGLIKTIMPLIDDSIGSKRRYRQPLLPRPDCTEEFSGELKPLVTKPMIDLKNVKIERLMRHNSPANNSSHKFHKMWILIRIN